MTFVSTLRPLFAAVLRNPASLKRLKRQRLIKLISDVERNAHRSRGGAYGRYLTNRFPVGS